LERDVLAAIQDGAQSLRDIQSRVRRRFRCVRSCLHLLERSGSIECHTVDGTSSWSVYNK
jgi:hypothetical protein